MTELMVACPTCGQVHEDLSAAEDENRRLRRRVTQLTNELAKQRRESPEWEAVQRLHERWQRLLNHPKAKLGPAREKAYLFGLRTFDEDMCNRAVDGCARMPFVGPKGRQATGERGGKRHDDPTLIFRDETTIERFAGYAEDRSEVAPSQGRLRVERLAWGLWRANGGGSIGRLDRWPEVRAEWVHHADEALRLARAGDGFAERDDQPRDDPTPISRPLDLRNVLEAFAARDLKVVGSGAQFKGQCPLHDDRTPSCSITEKPDGATLLNCFGCQAGHLELARALDLYGRTGGPVVVGAGQSTLEAVA